MYHRHQPRRHAQTYESFAELQHEDYSHLFPELEPFLPANDLLMRLGGHMGPMVDRDFGSQGDAFVRSAGITFLGQFITHDITFDRLSTIEKPSDLTDLQNFRTPSLELDCLYGMGPEKHPEYYDKQDRALLAVGKNDAGKDNDVVRDPDGRAVIGDGRNDENTIICQLHLAFIKFHNAVVRRLREAKEVAEADIFKEAQRIVCWHYQWMVLHDFLPQIVDKAVIDDILVNGRKFYKPEGRVTIPVEFSSAVFRFGHSIVKPHYIMNDVFGGGVLQQLVGLKPVKEEEVVQWHNFFWLDPAKRVQLGRKIDTKIAQPFFHLPEQIIPGLPVRSLPLITLRKGKTVGLPSGQAIATRMGYTPYSQEELGLADSGLTEAPLWYYILKEAELETRGERLGKVGGRIAAEVLIGLLQQNADSFLAQSPDWKPTLPSAIPGHFSIEDLLRFAGVADNKADQAESRDIKKRRKRLAKYHKKFKHVKVDNPLTHGRWDILHYDSQIEAVHMSLLPTKKVLYYSGFRVAEAVNTETRLWNPKDGDIKKPTTYGDIFCGGHCLTSSGRVLSTGGTMEYRNLPPVPPPIVRFIRPLAPALAKLFGSNPKFVIRFAGPTYLYRFDNKREEWEFVGDMDGGRWYPTNTLLPNGKVLILSGTDEAGGFGNSEVYAAINRRIEVYDEDTGLELVGHIPDFDTGHAHHDHHQDGDGHQHDIGGVIIDEGPSSGFPMVYPRMFVLP
ncbi:MAG: heme peroxidase family protein, partial [Saprospiraceae bacterium]|nr:heme peroxidase family protein [Saprospiraceae bacterium]